MDDILLALPEHVKKAYDAPLTNVRPEEFSHITSLVMCGMGGSGIAGTIIREFVDLPVHISKSPAPPPFIDHTTLAVCLSYSGNTWETLEAYHTLVKKNAHVVAVTSGGKLLERVVEEGKPHVTIPGGMLPRFSLPYLLFGTLKFLEAIGKVKEQNGIADFAQKLVSSPINEHAKDVAKQLVGRYPMIYGTSEAACFRFQTQLCENAKSLASYDLLFEFNHHIIEGWQGTAPENATLVFLRDPDERPELRTSFNYLKEISSAPVIELVPQGSTRQEKLLSLILLGDLISVHLAAEKGVDPSKTAYINTLKQKIKEIK